MKLFSILSLLSLCLVLSLMLAVSAEQCQGQCGGKPSPGVGDVASLISEDTFNLMLLHRNDSVCPASNFYTYTAFIVATKMFDAFGTKGDVATRKREIAAFLAQTSHETRGGLPTAPDGPYAWGYCIKEAIYQGDCCINSQDWPCVSGKKYYGRGPIQITYNYNYGPAGKYIGAELLADPDLVATDPYISFMTAIWFWMTPQSPKPSCHDVMVGNWKPSEADLAAGRRPGYGVVTNIINGTHECGHGYDAQVEKRLGFYMWYCDILGVEYGDHLNCYNQKPFGSEVSLVDSI